MDSESIFNSDNIGVIIVAAVILVVLLAAIGTVIYIRKASAKPTQFAAQLYDDWTEKFNLPPLLLEGKNVALENTKIIQKYLKIVYDKGEIDEIDLRWDIENLKQDDALAYANEATEYFLEKKYKGTKGFIYDTIDAREGNLRLFPLDKDSNQYKRFVLTQALLKMLREHSATLAEIPEIRVQDDAADVGLKNIQYILLSRSNLHANSSAMPDIVNTLSEKLGDSWEIEVISEDTLRFVRTIPEDELPEIEIASPFAKQEEAKRQADEEEAFERRQTEIQRRKLWESREKTEKEEMLEERDRAIAAGEISELVREPKLFLARAMQVASEESGITTIKDEPGIMRTDAIGRPTAFSIFSRAPLNDEDTWFDIYVESLTASLESNLTGTWEAQLSNDSTSVQFTRVVD